MLKLANQVLATVIYDELVDRATMLTRNYNLVTLGIIVIRVHPVTFRNQEGRLVTLVARQLKPAVLPETIAGFANHPIPVFTMNIIKVIVKQLEPSLKFLRLLPFQTCDHKDNDFHCKNCSSTNNKEDVVGSRPDD